MKYYDKLRAYVNRLRGKTAARPKQRNVDDFDYRNIGAQIATEKEYCKIMVKHLADLDRIIANTQNALEK
tara:strand:- start:198 stop:407 length:210 start_codon:yes stop_codon:yes gene_type:complete